MSTLLILKALLKSYILPRSDIVKENTQGGTLLSTMRSESYIANCKDKIIPNL